MRHSSLSRARGTLLWTLLAAALPLRAAEPAAPTLTLSQAVSLALEKNRQVQSAVLDVSRSEERLAQAKSDRWPSLSVDLIESRLLTAIDFQFNKGVFGDYPGIGPIPAKDTKVGTPTAWSAFGLGQFQFPISQQYKIGLNINLNKVSGEFYREQLRGQRQSTVDQVRKIYYGILQAEGARRAAEESLSLAREVERVVGDRFREEKALEVDHLEAQAQRARAEADVLKSRNAATQQKERLNNLLGRDVSLDFQVVEVAESTDSVMDLATARSRALELQPETRKNRLQVEQAQIDLKLTKAQYIPDLAFLASYISPFSVDFLPRNIYTVGFLFEWKIFDGGKRRHQVAEKRDQLEQARLAAAQSESSTLLDVGDQYRRLEEERQSLEAAKLNRTARRERLRISKDRYVQQVIIADDLLRAQADFADAERQYVQTLAAYWTARADLERAIGEDP